LETTKRDLAVTEPGSISERLRPVSPFFGAFWIDPEPPPRRLRDLLAERGLTLSPATIPGLAARVTAVGPAVLCFGPGSSEDEVRTALGDLERESPDVPCLSVVLAGTSDLAGFQELVDDDRLFYLSRGPLSERDLAGLIESAAGALPRRLDLSSLRGPDLSLSVDTLRRLALARTLPELAESVGSAILQATSAQRGRCLLFDPQRQALWSPAEGGEPESGESPAVGLASFILRTGLTLCLPRAGEDPRFDPDLDNPDGDPADRFLGVPVRAGEGMDRQAAAVLVAIRDSHEPPFEPREIAALEAAAAHVAPYLAALAPSAGSNVMQRGPFRERAIRERELSSMPLEPLRLAPGWTRWTYWLMLCALAAALLALVLVRVPEYASGVAVVRAGGRTEVTATAGGTVSSLAVEPQVRVRKGQLLLTLYSAEEAADLKRLERELESKLVQRLQSPSDPAIAQDLVALRSERELAQARLAERELRAPADGEVSDVRVTPGQLVQAGQPVLSILARSERLDHPSVIALLPGGYLPQLEPGMKLRLELPGHPYVYQWLALDSVAGEVIGPAEARRLLGPVAGDAVPLEGALAVVTAPLPSSTFEVAGHTYPYRDGMPTRAEVRVKSERLLFALLPALKSLSGRSNG
jgi:membrane fusion protein (multidrug efflux system)